LKESGGAGLRWVVVDDDPYGYPRDTPLILVDSAIGFTPEDAQRLIDMAFTRSTRSHRAGSPWRRS
jgi:hypothetical protein